MAITFGGKPAVGYVRCCECGAQWTDRGAFVKRCKDHHDARIDMAIGTKPDWWKSMKRSLHYCLNGSCVAGENRHAQTMMEDLGITYEHSTPQSLYDCWVFWNCENIPDVLPEWITEMEDGPMKYIGHGLTEEVAQRLEENK